MTNTDNISLMRDISYQENKFVKKEYAHTVTDSNAVNLAFWNYSRSE